MNPIGVRVSDQYHRFVRDLYSCCRDGIRPGRVFHPFVSRTRHQSSRKDVVGYRIQPRTITELQAFRAALRTVVHNRRCCDRRERGSQVSSLHKTQHAGLHLKHSMAKPPWTGLKLPR